MKTKKILAILLAFLIISCVNVTLLVAYAANTTLVVSSTHGGQGANVNVSVNISANSGLAAGSFVLNYDTTKLEVVSAVNGAALVSGASSVNNDSTKGTIKNAFVKDGGINDAGSILDVTFKIKPTASGTIPLTLSVEEMVTNDFNAISNTITQGSIVVDNTAASTLNPSGTSTLNPTATLASGQTPTATLKAGQTVAPTANNNNSSNNNSNGIVNTNAPTSTPSSTSGIIIIIIIVVLVALAIFFVLWRKNKLKG